MREAVVVAAKRTAIGRAGGMFRHTPPEQLAAAVIKDILEETRLDAGEIDDVILGNVVGPGGNLARLSALTAGLPVDVPGMTVDRQCGSGLEAVQYAARLVQTGAGEVFLAGGAESVSLAPWKVEKPASLYETKPPRMYTRARFAPEGIGDPEMGVAAENVAERYGVSREEQDRYALRSHEKAVKAQESGRFADEITAVRTVKEDECPRADLNLRRLARFPAAFKTNGTVTAANSCPVNDGAAITLVMSRVKAEAAGLVPILAFVDAATVGVDPNELGIGPVPAVRKLLERRRVKVEDLDLIEFNEAFSSQVVASLAQLEIPWEKVNVSGGAIALGHPYGASGAVLVTRLFHEMKAGQARTGLVTMGIGGGMGAAVLFKKGI